MASICEVDRVGDGADRCRAQALHERGREAAAERVRDALRVAGAVDQVVERALQIRRAAELVEQERTRGLEQQLAEGQRHLAAGQRQVGVGDGRVGVALTDPASP